MPASFYILATFLLLSAMGAMCLRNLVHCALCLAVSFISVAGLFLHLDAAFVAFAQILVYVGAVAILIVFAILLTKNSEEQTGKRSTALLPSLGVALLTGGLLAVLMISTPAFDVAAHGFVPTVRRLGVELMTTYIVPLQVIGVLLTAALLGAVIIAMKEPGRSGEGRE